jgi:type II secretory pathway pseudopilin PulG
MKNHTSKKRVSGFALIATLLMLILLLILAVGIQSVSAISLRSSKQSDAMLEAQANAKMALMMAIGELQRLAGPDMRVTAQANTVDEAYPSLLGVWKSWEGTNHDATGRPIVPNYGLKDQAESAGGRFVDWLVSSASSRPTPNLGDATSLVRTSAAANTVALLGEGSLAPTDTRQVHVVPTELENGGRIAWWVSGENQKARLAQPYEPRTDDAAGYFELGQSHTITDPSAFGVPALLTDREPYFSTDQNAKPGRRAVSRKTMALLVDENPVQPDKKFHDFTTYSNGLLTNTATGGWRKDLSILTERWDAIYASYPGARLPLFRLSPTAGSTTSVPKPTRPNANVNIASTGVGNTAVLAATPAQSSLYPWSGYSDLFITNNQRQPNYYQAASASWQSLVAFATSYKQFSINSGTVESPFVWDRVAGNNSTWGGGSAARVLNLYNYNHTQRLHPQIARFQAIVYARAVPRNPPANPLRYDLRMMWTPVITLWNPYNVGLTLEPLNSAIKEELLIGWTRSLPISLATVLQTAYPGGPSTVPNSAYRYISPGNFQYLDVNGNFNAEGYDTTLAANTAKGYPASSLMDVRTFGASFPPGQIKFKPGETKVFSPRFSGHVHWSGSIRLGEGFNSSNILGFEWIAAGNRLGSDRYWFLMNNDRATRPYRAMNGGLGFAMSFGISSGGFYQSHPSHVGVQQQFHNMSTLAPEAEGNAYWPSDEVDEVGYSVLELANGPWVPVFSVSLGPRMTIGSGSGTEQNRPTKGVLQSNPLAAMALVNPVSGDPKAHPANGTFDMTYHSMGMGSTLTPNLSTSKGFIATGYQSGDGLSRLVMTNIPLRPMASLVELEGWNPRGNNPCPPYQSNLIGNSDATPLIPNNAVAPSVLYPSNVQTNMMHDDAYCANHLLFDDWFVSSIAPQPYSFGNDIEKDINTVYRDFLKGDSRLVNRSYLPITSDSKLTDGDATTRIAQFITSNDGWLKIASRFEVEGMFNVNTTSVEAWKAILGHAKSLSQIATHGANGIDTTNVSNKHVVTRGAIASDVEAGSGAGFGAQFANASEYTGFRSLSDDQIEDLAEKIVEQIRLRGPFLSLSEFVNRQLSNNEDLALAGAIQTAINSLSDDPMAELRDPANSLSANTMAANDPKLAGVNYEFNKAAEGSSAYGAPGWIRQADILRPIAPILTVRDDTFTIRTYGDARDKEGKVIAKAWCEAVVKRTREFIDPSDAADSVNPPVNSLNIKYGRRFEIVSFRWLNSNEV